MLAFRIGSDWPGLAFFADPRCIGCAGEVSCLAWLIGKQYPSVTAITMAKMKFLLFINLIITNPFRNPKDFNIVLQTILVAMIAKNIGISKSL
jgi:hypothetical protein